MQVVYKANIEKRNKRKNKQKINKNMQVLYKANIEKRNKHKNRQKRNKHMQVLYKANIEKRNKHGRIDGQKKHEHTRTLKKDEKNYFLTNEKHPLKTNHQRKS